MIIDNYIRDELIDNLIRTNNELSEILPTHKSLCSENVNHIFRTIHSLKGNAFYMDVDHIGDWASKIENILSKMRDGLSCSEEILNWLNNAVKQADEWIYQLQNNLPLSYITIYAKEPDFLDEDNSIVYDMQILYIGNRENIKKILNYKFPKYYATTEFKKIKSLIEDDSIEIVIFDDEVNNLLLKKSSELMNKHKGCTLVISTTSNTLGNYIPMDCVFNPKKEKLVGLNTKIFNAVKKNYDLTKKVRRRLNLKIKYIDYLISNVTAMPESIRKIQRIIDDPEFKMKNLIEAVKQDPIATGIIIKASNDPLYKFDMMKKDIDKLVILFGPKLILSILIKKMLSMTFKHNLSPYGITISEFLHLSNLRSIIVNKWINKNGYYDLTDVIIATFLASLGQYILSEDIMFIGKEGLFKNLIEDNIQIRHAEKQIAGYAMTHLSSILLENWEFKHDIHYGLLRVENYNTDLKDIKIKKIAMIVSFMFSAIDQTGKRNMQYDYTNDFEELGLDLNSLEKIINDFT